MLGQGLRYVLAGSFVSLVYLLTTTILALVVGLPFEVALTIGFSLGLVVHFNLQRFFVWVHHEGFALPPRRQARRYLAVAGTQYGITTASTALLPPVVGLSHEVVYLATTVLLTLSNFVVFRHGVFHPPQTDGVGHVAESEGVASGHLGGSEGVAPGHPGEPEGASLGPPLSAPQHPHSEARR
jgi:putative flippase GtrA